MGGFRLCTHHDARGQLVEPVHNAGALDPADAGQLTLTVMQKRIDERARPAARGGMHRHASWLVDHNQVCVLVQDVERDVLWLRRSGNRLWQGERIGLAGANRRARIIRRHAIYGCRTAFLDQRFRPRSRDILKSI